MVALKRVSGMFGAVWTAREVGRHDGWAKGALAAAEQCGPDEIARLATAHVPSWTLGTLLDGLARTGTRPAVLHIHGGEVQTVTGAELLRRVNGAAHLLCAAGVGKGDVVAVWARNSPNWIAAGLACGYLGAILAPLDAAGDAAEIPDLVAQIDARVLCTDKDSASALGDGFPIVILDDIVASETPPPAANLDPDDPIVLFRTSGTTGTPKKFHLSCVNVGAAVNSIAEWGGVSDQDRVLLPLPMHHVFPWITATLAGLTVGVTLILPESPTGPHIATALKLTRPTVLIGVPKLYEAILDGVEARIRHQGRIARAIFNLLLGLSRQLCRLIGRRLGSLPMTPIRRAVAAELRLIVSGGAHLKAETEEALTAFGWDVRTGYGLSETAAAFTGTFYETRPGSAGKPVGGAEIRIDNPDAHGVGEILLRGPTVFSGYLDNPEANARAFDADGFFRTGDLGYLDRDGFLYVTGRLKEVIVLSGGDNLYPEDVEDRYLSDPCIAEIGVMERHGALVALIVPNNAMIAKVGALDPGQAIKVAVASIAKDLPSTWRLSGFRLSREPLPRTRLGKLRRFMLPKLYEQSGALRMARKELTAEQRVWLGETPRKEVWGVLTAQRGREDLDLDSSMQVDLGFDSFDWMTLAVSIEQASGVRLEMTDIAGIATVRELLEVVTSKASASARPLISEERLLAEDRKWLEPRGIGAALLGHMLWGLNDVLMRLVFRLDVSGRENIPRRGPALICPNHVSDLDPAAIAAALPYHARARTKWSADKVRVFGSWWQDLFCRAVGIFPVDERWPMIAVTLAKDVLDDGGLQVWFPEGWRSADGKLLEFGAGVGHIVEDMQTQVIPVYISGTLAAWPRERRLPRPGKVQVVFGEPLSAHELMDLSGDSDGRAGRIAAVLRGRLGAVAKAHGGDIL